MTYPTIEQVNKAEKLQLGKWVRLLPSPQVYPLLPGKDKSEQALVMDRIIERFHTELRGWTPELSKQIGWE